MSGDRNPILWPDLDSVELPHHTMAVYDRPIGIKLLREDARTGAEDYLVRYEAGTRSRWHRYSAGHTIVVLEGRLRVNDDVIGPGSYCHYPAMAVMRHEPAGDEPCLFLNLFDGPSDVEVVEPG